MGEYADDTIESSMLYALDHGEPFVMESYSIAFAVYQIIKETGKAWLITLVADENRYSVKEMWLPKSKCQLETRGDKIWINIPGWLAARHGLPIMF